MRFQIPHLEVGPKSERAIPVLGKTQSRIYHVDSAAVMESSRHRCVTWVALRDEPLTRVMLDSGGALCLCDIDIHRLANLVNATRIKTHRRTSTHASSVGTQVEGLLANHNRRLTAFS